MTDRPILFSAPMVQAILAGRKTQTRRVLKPQPRGLPYLEDNDDAAPPHWRDGWTEGREPCGGATREVSMPLAGLRFAVGDRLWVRETWAHYQTVNHIRRSHGGSFDEVSDGLAGYRADGHDTIEDFRQHVRLMSGCDLEAVVIKGDCWRPSIFMPRWASRITLDVTDVRVQRLQDISEEDAKAEGALLPWTGWSWDKADDTRTGRSEFEALWNSINGDGAWEANPWIVALTFSPLTREAAHG